MERASVLVGWVSRAHGIRGDVRTKASGPTLRGLAPGTSILLRRPDGEESVHRVLALSGEPERPILRLDGVTDRDAAAVLARAEIHVDRALMPVLDDPDTFYVRDLLGHAVTVGDRVVGRVADVIPGPANDTLEVHGDGDPVLIPFTADAVLSVDPAGVIAVREGLIGP